jgi:iron complex transport system ATP-binding protein
MSILAVKNVSVTFNGGLAVDDVSFELTPGALVGLIGPNGAGKTTLLRAIANLIPFSGQVFLQGQDLAPMPRAKLAKALAYLAQGHISHWPLQVRHVVALGRQPHLSALGRVTSKDEQIISDVMRRTDIEQFTTRNVLALSGGERARVMLARALAVNADVLLADEPVASLDPFYQLQIMELLRELATAGKTIVVVTHDLTLAARFCDWLILLAQGQLIANGRVDDVLTEDQVSSAYHVDVVRAQHGSESYILPVRRLLEPIVTTHQTKRDSTNL